MGLFRNSSLQIVNTPLAKTGGFGLRLKAGSIGHTADCPGIHLRWYSTTPVHCSRPYTIYINSSLRRRPQSRPPRGVISLDAGLRRHDDLPPNGGGFTDPLSGTIKPSAGAWVRPLMPSRIRRRCTQPQILHRPTHREVINILETPVRQSQHLMHRVIKKTPDPRAANTGRLGLQIQ